MNTFKLTQPTIGENNVPSDIVGLLSSFSEFVSNCGYKFVNVDKFCKSDANYTVFISDNEKEMPIEMIIGKSYIRLMNKRLNPTITSQITYEKDLEFEKYKNNLKSLIESAKEFDNQERIIAAKITGLLKLETSSSLDHYKSKYGVDELHINETHVVLIKNVDDATKLIIKLYGHSNKFRFTVIYPENEVFNILNNFLPENNFEPKMNGINGRMEEYNKIAGEIIQKVINDENKG